MSGPDSKPTKIPRDPSHWRPVDMIALVLATSLGLTVVLILVVSAIQVVHGSFPQVKLSENSTQIIIAGTGGLTGLLGAYIGLNRENGKSRKPQKPPEIPRPPQE